MKTLFRICFFLWIALASAGANAKTAVWAIKAQYTDLKRYCGDLLLCKKDGKWGVIKTDGKVVVEPKFDFITEMKDGHALVANAVGTRYKLVRILRQDGSSVDVEGDYYLTKYSYFSEGMLLVTDIQGMYGYLNSNGKEAIPCQFEEEAGPFSCGYAMVVPDRKSLVQYITSSYNSKKNKTLTVDFRYGKIMEGSNFSKEGRAVVANGNNYAEINLSGKVVEKLKKEEYFKRRKKYNAVPKENGYPTRYDAAYSIEHRAGKYGYSRGGTPVVTPYFDAADSVSADGCAVVTLNGAKGLIRFVDQDIRATLTAAGKEASTTELGIDRRGNVDECRLELAVPAGITHNPLDLRIRARYDDGGEATLTGGEQLDNRAIYTFTPQAKTQADSCHISIEAFHDGLPVLAMTKTFGLAYPVVPRISDPRTSPERADRNDEQRVYCIIHNDANKETVCKATLTVKGAKAEETLKIPAKGSQRISVTVKNVLKEETVEAKVTLGTGDTKTGKVTLKPYL